MRRAALYARFSSELQSKSSIDDQIALCRKFCDREGYVVVGVYSDRALSGTSMHGRDGLDALRAEVVARNCDVVVVEDFDRLSRSMTDLPLLWEEMTFAGVQLVSVNDGVADHLKIGVRNLTSSLYIVDLKHKTRRGLEGKLRAGMRAAGLPYGYRPIPGRPGEHTIHEPEAAIVRRIFAEFADGNTPRDIANALNTAGISPMRGRTWNASTIGGDVKRAAGMLSNEIYRGQIVWNKVSKVKNPATGKRVPRINPQTAWVRVDAPHLRIVDEGLWLKVQEQRRRRSTGPRLTVSGPKRVLSGLLKCPLCDSTITSCGSRRGVSYGRCARANESGSCTNRYRYRLDLIERFVIEGLRDELTHPASIAEAVREYHAELRRLAGSRAQTRRSDMRRAEHLRRTASRLVDAVADGELPASAVARKLGEVEQELQQVETRLAAMPDDVVTLHPQAVEHYLKLLDKFPTTPAAIDPKAWAALRGLIHSIVVHPREGRSGSLHLEVRGKLAAILTGQGVGPPVPRDVPSLTHKPLKKF